MLRDHAVRRLRHPRPGGGNGRRLGPCLLSFRHGFAVGQLNARYRQGADMQRLLPVLSTCLGHRNPTGTRVYLSVPLEGLHQASLCYEHYMKGDEHT